MSATILLVEDEEDLASIVQYHLKKMDTQLFTQQQGKMLCKH